MATLARDVMTPKPARCSPSTTLDVVAKLMVKHNCGEIPVVDGADQVIGVVTDRDIVCRVVAHGRNPSLHGRILHVFPRRDAAGRRLAQDVISTMEGHQIGVCRSWTMRVLRGHHRRPTRPVRERQGIALRVVTRQRISYVPLANPAFVSGGDIPAAFTLTATISLRI